MTKTVYVLGAGASREVGLPVGEQLMDSIKPLLDIQYDHQQVTGDRLIARAIEMHAKVHDEHLRFQKAAWQIRDCMDLAPSIDNFIDSRRGDPYVELCGKLAITRAILSAEKASSLYLGSEQNLKHGNLKTTWFNKFAKLLTTRCHQDELPARLSQVAFVIFNYDRCFEHFIAHYLKDYYSIPLDEAQAHAESIEIYHPYGTVGGVPWKGYAYGREPAPQDLLAIAKGLKTFTEAERPSEIDSIHKLMAASPRVVFLGFGFLGLNMDLLFPAPASGTPARNARFYGTALEMSAPNVDAILESVTSRLGMHPDYIQLVNLKAAPMMEWFRQRLTFE